ncbi:MAG TPA: plastocyanin/azurin family copper-binding protein, partial [Candidatus Limnocylindrales bacterium]|nr:plastocyanin/azurin family copper-binding protein [Candidatus Limnocylindrales bacterium]
MQKGVLAAVALTAGLAAAAPAYAAGADVYARDTGSGGLCFSTSATATDCAPEETADVNIEPGESVTFHFDGTTGAAGPHNAADADASPAAWKVPEDGSFVTSGAYPHQFDAEGTYTFICQVHPQMKGTVTVGTPDPPPDDDPPSSPPSTGGTHTTTPPPSGGTDSVKPTIKRVKLKALRRAVRVRFRLSEPASVTVRVKRGRKLLKARRVQAGAGTHSVTLRSKRLKKG